MEMDMLYYDLHSQKKPLYIPNSREYAAFDMELQRDISAAGILRFSIPLSHPATGELLPRKTEISVVRNGEERWTGFINRIKNTEPGVRTYECVGVFGYFNDSIQLPFTASLEHSEMLEFIMSRHNDQMADALWKQVELGVVGYSGTNVSISLTEPKTTMQVLQEYFGFGVLSLRRIDGHTQLVLEHRAGRTIASNQPIKYGENLIDLEQERDYSEIHTIFIPLGAKDENTGERVNISSVNDGSIYVYTFVDVKNYTPIAQTIEFDDISDPAELLAAIKIYIAERDQAAPKISVSASAADRSYIDDNYEPLVLGGVVQIASPLHETEANVECTSVSEVIGDPGSTKFKFENL